MVEQKSESMIVRVVFSLFLVLVFSLGMMEPAIPTGLATLTPTDLVFPFLFLGWLLALATRQLKFVWHPAFVAIAVYFLALALSLIVTTRPRASLVKLAGEFYLILLPVIVVSIVTSIESLKRTLLAWSAGAVVPVSIGLLGIVLFYAWPNSSLLGEITYHYGAVPVGPFPRLSSTFISASMFCNYLTVTFALIVACRFRNWIPRREARLFTFLIIPCAALTVSIAGGGFLLAGGLIAWKVRPERLRKLIGLGVALVGAVGFLLIAPFSLGDIGSLNPSSRMLVWTDAWNRFLASPIIGSGVGTAVASVTYQNTDGSWSLLTDAHNTFLNVAGQAGIVGLAAFVFVIVAVIRAGLHRGHDSLALVRSILLIAFVAAFLYDGLTGSFEDARHLWVLIGLILAVDRIAQSTEGR